MSSLIRVGVPLIASLAAASALHLFGVGLVVTLPWWLGLAGPATVYAVLALAALERVSWTMRGAVFMALSAVHAALTASIGVLFVLMGAGNYLEALSTAALSFLPVPLIPLIGAPLALLPFRSVLAPAPQSGRPRSSHPTDARAGQRSQTPASSPRQPAPVAPPVASPRGSEAERPTGRLHPSGATRVGGPAGTRREAAVGATVLPFVPPRRSTPDPVESVAPVMPAEPVAPAEEPAPAREVTMVEAVPVAEPVAALEEETTLPSRQAVETPAEPEQFISVSFDKVADQLPLDHFSLPVDGLAAALQEPGRLMIPRRLIMRQLAAGAIRVDWADIAEQFPTHSLTSAGGAIVLPLEEIVRSLPPEVWALPTPPLDLSSLERFPLPFQPPAMDASEPVVAATAVEAGEAGPPATVEPSEVAEAESRDSVLPVADIAPDHPVVGDPVEKPVSSGQPPADEESVAVRQAEWRRLAAALVPGGGMGGGVEDAGGVTLFTFITASLPSDAVAAMARRCLPLFAGSAAGPVEQVIARCEAGAVVLTPLGERQVMVAAAARSGSLALLEIRSRRAAAGAGNVPVLSVMAGRSLDDAVALEPVAGGPAAELLASALGDLSPVSPTVLREANGELEVCVLLPPGEGARPAGLVARAAVHALGEVAAADRGLGRLESVELVRGASRLVLQPTDSVARFTMAALTGEAARRPGWARARMLRDTTAATSV